jgi:hypothetical protein
MTTWEQFKGHILTLRNDNLLNRTLPRKMRELRTARGFDELLELVDENIAAQGGAKVTHSVPQPGNVLGDRKDGVPQGGQSGGPQGNGGRQGGQHGQSDRKAG